jgi:hypothetical protein
MTILLDTKLINARTLSARFITERQTAMPPSW